MLDHALMVMYEGDQPRLEVPDHALDMHTARGRRMGRGFEHYLNVGARLVQEVGVGDPYADEARAACLATEAQQAPRQITLAEASSLLDGDRG